MIGKDAFPEFELSLADKTEDESAALKDSFKSVVLLFMQKAVKGIHVMESILKNIYDEKPINNQRLKSSGYHILIG